MHTMIRRSLQFATIGAIALTAVAVPKADAVTGSAGAHTSGVATCTSPDSRSMTMGAPTMKAFNSTNYVDSQYVAWRPVLYNWSPASQTWVQSSGGMWSYGLATDGASPSAWYDLSTGARVNGSQTMATIAGQSKYWMVAYDMYWYATTKSGTASDLLWARAFTSPIGAILPYCTQS